MKVRIKKHLKKFLSYTPDSVDYKIRLNANELPFDETANLLSKINDGNLSFQLKKNSINRYPDPSYSNLLSKIAKKHKISTARIVLSNGSDELILNLVMSLTGKTSRVLTFDPTFSMYEILSQVINVKCNKILLDKNFDIPLNTTLKKIKNYDPDIIFIASPNNPTANSFSKDKILKIIEESNGLVVVDEAYADYSQVSFVNYLSKYKNLAIMKTMSKVGFASLRVGYLLAHKDIINVINKVRLPYNLSTLSSIIAQDFFDNQKKYKNDIDKIIKERERIFLKLRSYEKLEVYHSDSNFIFIKFNRSKALYKYLLDRNINIKIFSNSSLKNYFRITIGTPRENNLILSCIKNFIYHK